MRHAVGIRAVARFALAPVGFAAGVAASAALREARGGWAELSPSAMLVVGLAAPLAALVAGVRAAQAWRALGRDLAGGVVLRFAGRGRSVAVLPHTGFALEWNGDPAARARRLAIGEAAAVPSEMPTYAVDLATASAARGLDVVRRALSSAERDELGSHARRLARLPTVLVVFTASIVALSARSVGGAESAEPGAGTLVAVWASFNAYAWWRFLRARALARKLHDDVANGWALRATAGGLAGNEVLAVSGAAWTVQGAPAPWRTRARRPR